MVRRRLRRGRRGGPAGCGASTVAGSLRGGHDPGQELHLARRPRTVLGLVSSPGGPGAVVARRRAAGTATAAAPGRAGRLGAGRSRTDRSGGVARVRDGLPRDGAGRPLWTSSPTYLTPTPGRGDTGSRRGVVGGRLRGQYLLRRPARHRPRLQRGLRHQGVRRLRAPHPAGRTAASWRAEPPAQLRRPGPVPGRALLGVLPGGDVQRRSPDTTGWASSSRRPARPGPKGAVFDREGRGRGSLPDPGRRARHPRPRRPSGGWPGDGRRRETVVPVTQPRPGLVADRDRTEHGPQVLRLRLTDVPGWHATLDGRPLSLARFAASCSRPGSRRAAMWWSSATGPGPSPWASCWRRSASSALGAAPVRAIGWCADEESRPATAPT